VDLEARRLQAGCDVRANRRLAFMHRLARLDQHGIIGPVGKDLLEVLARACDVGPLDVSAQQRLLFGCDIE